MTRTRKSFFILFAVLAMALFYSNYARSNLFCFAGGTSIDMSTGPSKTFPVQISPVTLSRTTDNFILTDMSASVYCKGYPTLNSRIDWKDALRSTTLTIADSLTDLGFTGYLKYEGGAENPAPASNICLWPDANCSITTSESQVNKPLYAKIGIKKSTATTWVAGATIPAGTEIARLVTQGRTSGDWTSNYATFSFILNNDMVIPSYTCDVDYYDKSVTLGRVDRWDLVKHGTGRYANVTAPFKFDLSCEPQSIVSITLQGATLTDAEDNTVLANTIEGNENIGFQILFKDKPVKLDQSLLVVENASNKETLTFDTYYYYRGGALQSGQIKSVATFLFTYQ